MDCTSSLALSAGPVLVGPLEFLTISQAPGGEPIWSDRYPIRRMPAEWVARPMDEMICFLVAAFYLSPCPLFCFDCAEVPDDHLEKCVRRICLCPRPIHPRTISPHCNFPSRVSTPSHHPWHSTLFLGEISYVTPLYVCISTFPASDKSSLYSTLPTIFVGEVLSDPTTKTSRNTIFTTRCDRNERCSPQSLACPGPPFSCSELVP